VEDVTNISSEAAMDREYAMPSSRLRRAAAAARRSVRRWRRPEMRSVSLRYTQLPAAQLHGLAAAISKVSNSHVLNNSSDACVLVFVSQHMNHEG
jgi:hypothetical protein